MAPTTAGTSTQQQQMLTSSSSTTTKPPKPTRLACFSFAAYAKTLIENLKSLNVPVSPGLTDQEFSSLEITLQLNFPPDLRSILQAGLPIGNHWPNWRSSSPQQLLVLLNLPAMSLSKNVNRNNFWSDSWGERKTHKQGLSGFIRQVLKRAPVLVPIYKNCYIPTTPNLAGNPVFYVDDKQVCVSSFDVSGFFQEIEQFLQLGVLFKPLFTRLSGRSSNNHMNMPAWAATEAREIEFWSDAAENGRRMVARGESNGWWSGTGMLRLEGCLEEVFWRLRDGGWTDEEVRDMMMMIEMDGCDESSETQSVVTNKEEMAWNVKVLSLVLLRAGWSTEDVVYSLDLENDDGSDFIEGMSFVEHRRRTGSCSKMDDDRQKSSINHVMHVQSLEAM